MGRDTAAWGDPGRSFYLFISAVLGLCCGRAAVWLQCLDFLFRGLLLIRRMGPRVQKLRQLLHTGLVAPLHVESSQTRGQTCVPCINRQIRNPWTTRSPLEGTLHLALPPGGSDGKALAATWETRVLSLGWEDLLEKEMATHSSTLAWKIPWMEEPGRLQSMGFQESDMTVRLHFHFFSISEAQ